jgi:hypothetical protein
MTKYQLKHIQVDAVQFRPDLDVWPEGVVPWSEMPSDYPRPRDCSWGYIQTPAGTRHVLSRDWIVTTPDGGKHLYRPDEFRRLFELSGGEDDEMDTETAIAHLRALVNANGKPSNAVKALETLERYVKSLETMNQEWLDKTEWVQRDFTHDRLNVCLLGEHRADVIKAEVDYLRAEVRRKELRKVMEKGT